MESFRSDHLSFVSDHYKKLSEQLFHGPQYVVVPNFLTPSELKDLRTYFHNGQNLSMIGSQDNYHHFLAKYYFKNDSHSVDSMSDRLFAIANRACLERNKICLQPNSDRHMQAYCLRFGIDPEHQQELVDSQMNHSFIRLANYRKGQGQIPHRDYPGEIQCIVPLTEYGVDYQKGGLYLINENDQSETHIDPLVKPGDLIILNSYAKIHRVEPVECRDDQMGRMHIFLPIIPDYQFSSETYYFSHSPMRPFFIPKMSRAEKLFYRLFHYYLLLFRRKQYQPVDLR